MSRGPLFAAKEASEPPGYTLWCNDCQRDRMATLENGNYWCPCGEPIRCDECGYELDRDLNCERPGGHQPERPERAGEPT